MIAREVVAEVVLRRGVRQGCPLSGSLCSIAAHPLLRRLAQGAGPTEQWNFAHTDKLTLVLRGLLLGCSGSCRFSLSWVRSPVSGFVPTKAQLFPCALRDWMLSVSSSRSRPRQRGDVGQGCSSLLGRGLATRRSRRAVEVGRRPFASPRSGCVSYGTVFVNFSGAMSPASSSSSSSSRRRLGRLRPPTGGHCNPSLAHRGWLCHRLCWKMVGRLGSLHLHPSSLFCRGPGFFW